MIEAAMTASMFMLQGSQGFFVSPGNPQISDPNGPPTDGFSGW